MISHRNVIANVLQICTYEKPYRDSTKPPGAEDPLVEVALGLLPQSHIYSLVVICHATTYGGDQVINLPKFEIQQYLNSIQRFGITMLYLVSHSSDETAPANIFSRLCQELSSYLLKRSRFSPGSTHHHCHDQE